MKKIATPPTLIEDARASRTGCNLYGGQDERLLTTPEAASHLRVSKSYLDKLRVYGGGPEFIRLGKRKILYRTSDLDLWAGQRRFGSTSEYRDDGNSQPESGIIVQPKATTSNNKLGKNLS